MDAAAIIAWIANFLISFLTALGYWGAFLAMLVEGASLPISSEVVLLFAGFLVWQGQFSLWGMALAGALGFVIGSFLPYTLGRRYGKALWSHGGRLIFTSDKETERVQNWFARYGDWAITLARVVPLIRVFVSFPAGSSKIPAVRFAAYTFLGIFPWTLFVVWVGKALGKHWARVIEAFATGNSVILWGIFALILFLVFRKIYSVYRSRTRENSGRS